MENCKDKIYNIYVKVMQTLLEKHPIPISARKTEEKTTHTYMAYEAIEKLMKDYDFHTVLDVGCGEGLHSDIFRGGERSHCNRLRQFSLFYEK